MERVIWMNILEQYSVNNCLPTFIPPLRFRLTADLETTAVRYERSKRNLAEGKVVSRRTLRLNMVHHVYTMLPGGDWMLSMGANENIYAWNLVDDHVTEPAIIGGGPKREKFEYSTMRVQVIEPGIEALLFTVGLEL
jgi:hypothetical protein